MSEVSKVCRVDQDNSVSLDSILKSFHCGIKEEQAWALIYQSIVFTELHQINHESDCFAEPKDLFITVDGDIHSKTFEAADDQNVSVRQLWSKIALIIYNALDYGLSENEELRLSNDLHDFFSDMLDLGDEGIVAEEFSSDILKEKCRTRITDQTITDTAQHYRSVCRALVAEALDLSTFLCQVSIGNKELNRIRNDSTDEVDLKIEVWAQVWMKVMRELRFSYTFKKLNKVEIAERQQKEYEMTPFEMLLADINSQRYKLKKVSLPERVEKDARTVILDYIRSGPRLKPVSERKLSPRPQTEPSLHQRVMDGIKSPPVLKPTPKPFERQYGSVHLPRGKRFSIYTKSVVIEPPREGKVFQRFNFRNLSLRNLSYERPSGRRNYIEEEPEPNPEQSSKDVPFWRRLFRW